MSEQVTPRIVTCEEWERARAELLVREKAHTHAGDGLAAERRRLPMTPMSENFGAIVRDAMHEAGIALPAAAGLRVVEGRG